MNKPEDFILTTDYATSKGDGRASVQVTMPGGTTVPAAGFATVTQDFEVGSIGSIMRCRIASSKNSNQFYVTPQISFTRNASPGMYPIFAYVSRVSPSTVRATVIIPNPYNVSFSSASGNETFTFEVTTIIPPVPN